MSSSTSSDDIVMNTPVFSSDSSGEEDSPYLPLLTNRPEIATNMSLTMRNSFSEIIQRIQVAVERRRNSFNLDRPEGATAPLSDQTEEDIIRMANELTTFLQRHADISLELAQDTSEGGPVLPAQPHDTMEEIANQITELFQRRAAPPPNDEHQVEAEGGAPVPQHPLEALEQLVTFMERQLEGQHVPLNEEQQELAEGRAVAPMLEQSIEDFGDIDRIIEQPRDDIQDINSVIQNILDRQGSIPLNGGNQDSVEGLPINEVPWEDLEDIVTGRIDRLLESEGDINLNEQPRENPDDVTRRIDEILARFESGNNPSNGQQETYPEEPHAIILTPLRQAGAEYPLMRGNQLIFGMENQRRRHVDIPMTAEPQERTADGTRNMEQGTENAQDGATPMEQGTENAQDGATSMAQSSNAQSGPMSIGQSPNAANGSRPMQVRILFTWNDAPFGGLDEVAEQDEVLEDD